MHQPRFTAPRIAISLPDRPDRPLKAVARWRPATMTAIVGRYILFVVAFLEVAPSVAPAVAVSFLIFGLLLAAWTGPTERAR